MGLMMKLTIGRRLQIGFALVVLLLIVGSATLHCEVSKVKHSQAQAVRLENWAKLIITKQTDHYKWLNGLNATFLQNLEGVTVQTDDHQCGLGKWLYGEEPKQLAATDPVAAQLLKDLEAPHHDLHAAAIEIDQLWRKSHEVADSKSAARYQEEALKIKDEQVAQSLAQTQAVLDELQEHLAKRSEAFQAELTATTDWMEYMNIGIGLVAALIAVLAAVIITRAIVRPIQILINRLRDIAEGEGDLTQRVDENRADEIGELGRWFNRFIEKIHDVIVEVRLTTTEVAGASTEIASSAEELAATMDQQNQQATQISAAMEQVSVSVVEVARKSADAADSAASAGGVAEEGGQVVAESIHGMEAINEAVTAGAVSVQELGKRGEQIGQIIEVINDIADQTNLLALNAAIEAARAGEHGRGFAVVADEVRKLADRTTKATEEIAQSIKAIQVETTRVVDRMNVGAEQVEAGVERASQSDESLKKIVTSAQDVASMIQSIAAAAEQQSTAVEQVSRNVESINSATQQASEGTGQAALAAASLSTKAETLQQMVGRFKIADRSAA